MATTLEALEQRVEALEHQMGELREQAAKPNGQQPHGSFLQRMLAKAEAERPMLIELSKKVMAQMGIPDEEPIPIEELHALMLKEGIKPEECLFSRGIREMREE